MKKWLILITTGLAIMLTNLDLTIVNLGLPDIAHQLNASLTQMQWVMSGYLLAGAMCFLLFGKLADKYGVKRIFLIGESIFVASSLLAALSQTIDWLILARLLQGIGFAATLGLSLIIIVNAFPAHQKGLASGAAITITGVSQAIGPTLGGLILHYLSWRWIFLINLPIGTIAIVGTSFLTPKDTTYNRYASIDYLAVSLLTIAMACLIFAINQMTSLKLWLFCSLITIAVLLLLGFIKRNNHSQQPLIPHKMLRHRAFVLISLSRVNFMFYMMTMLFIVPLYLINVVNLSAIHTGLLMLMMTTSAAVTSPVCGILIDRKGYLPLLRLSFVIAIIGLVFLVYVGSSMNYSVLLPGLMFYGIAVGLHIASSINGVLVSTEKQHHGVATGTFFTLGMLGGSLGVALSGSILNLVSHTALSDKLPVTVLNQQLYSLAKGSSTIAGYPDKILTVIKTSFMSAFHTINLVLIAVMLLALIFTLIIPKNKS